jgi:hypothetical protein
MSALYVPHGSPFAERQLVYSREAALAKEGLTSTIVHECVSLLALECKIRDDGPPDAARHAQVMFETSLLPSTAKLKG